MLDLKGKRVLLAEDHPLNAQIAIKMMAKHGMETVHGSNGKAALEIFESYPADYFDVILMDVRMPIMDGLETAREIRRLSREDAKRIPIIALSANAYEEDVQKSLDAGMDAHLPKPVQPEHIFETISKIIQNKQHK